MRKLFLVVAALAALITAPAEAAWAQDTDGSWYEDQAVPTRAIPAITTKTDWVPLTGVRGFDLEVCATNGNTLGGAGKMNAYRKGLLAPLRNPSLDAQVNVIATDCQGAACRCMTFPNYKTHVGIGGFMFATSGVTVSAGATVRVRITPTAQTAMLLRGSPALLVGFFPPPDVGLPHRRQDVLLFARNG